jgi:formamidopyrimidine-DNA glycosylase
MPELPEVETIARGLRERLPQAQRIVSVCVTWPRTVATPTVAEFVRGVVGQRVRGVGRRGKFLLLSLDGAELVMHLRMSGRILCQCEASGTPPPWLPYVRLHLTFASGLELFFVDMRKFGRVYLVRDAEEIVGDLGPEPLAPGLDVEALKQCLCTRRRQLKPLLLDQRVLAGLGNIYVDEALWAAELHPLRRSDTLSDEEVARLHAAIRQVLRDAVRNRGTTLRDYRNVADESGENQAALAVYGRAGQPCPRCGAAIRRQVVGGRGTHLCPVCQPEAEGVGDEEP